MSWKKGQRTLQADLSSGSQSLALAPSGWQAGLGEKREKWAPATNTNRKSAALRQERKSGRVGRVQRHTDRAPANVSARPDRSTIPCRASSCLPGEHKPRRSLARGRAANAELGTIGHSARPSLPQLATAPEAKGS